MEQLLERKKVNIPFFTSYKWVCNFLKGYYKIWENQDIVENEEDYYKTIKKIIKHSDIFHWVNDDMILKWLKDQKIKVNYLSPWNPIIKEWMTKCDSIYLLLCWELDVYKWDVKINTIEWMWVVWEMAFLNPKLKRTATVKTTNWAYILMLTRDFINSLWNPNSEIIKQNLYNSITEKLIQTNESIATKKDDESEINWIITSNIKNKVSSVYIWTLYE